MARVTLSNISKTYPGGNVAVRGVSLDIEDHEFMVLVGPSGCGKSTTLRMIAGLEDISSGEISIGEKVVNDVAPKDRDIAMVFQNYALYPHMTVYKNMAFGLKMRRFPKAEIDKRVRDAAKILDIERLLDRKPKALSGGERQRVALGRAIVRDPQVFLFDEPLSNLDARLRVQMRAEIQQLHNRLDATMIYVTHDQVEAMTMGDRIAVMYEGEVQQVDTPMKLYAEPANKFVAGFIGSPPMNFQSVTVRKNGGVVEGPDKRVRLNVDEAQRAALASYTDHEVFLGLRPEAFAAAPDQKLTDGKSIVATVQVVEPMGSETFLYLDCGEHIVARIEPGAPLPSPGDEYIVNVDMAQAHYFDANTEAAIR